MSYATGAIQSATQPAKDLMDTVGTTIDAHAAWEFVEEVAGTGTNVSRVYRCLGTSNGFADFHVAMTRTSLTSGVVMVAGEGYDSVNKKLTNPAPYFTTTPTAPDTDTSYPTDRHVANETTLTATTQGFMYGAGSLASNTFTGMLNNTTGFTYWVFVGTKYLGVATRVGTTGYFAMANLYDSFHAVGADPFPLWVGTLASPATTFQAVGVIVGSYTRALTTTATNYQYMGGIDSTPWTPFVSGNFTTAVTKETISAKWFPSRIMLMEGWRRNSMRGLLNSAVLAINMGENVESMGDTVTIDGQLYTCMSTGPGLTTAAASIWVSQA